MLKKLLLEWLNWLLGKTAKPEPLLPTSTERIEYADLYALLRSKAPMADIFLSDKDYLLCSRADIKTFLATDKTNKQVYVAQKFDCDDFSYRLMGQFSVPGWSDLAFGLVWSDKHALNCFVDENKEFWLIEPQNDTIQSGLLSWQGDHYRVIMM